MQRKSRPLGKPFRTPGHRKKFAVYVKDPKTGRIRIVRFGDPGLKIRQTDPKRRKNFRARHRCDQQTDRMTPAYWSCKWGWPKAGKPRLQASAAEAALQETTDIVSGTNISIGQTMNNRSKSSGVKPTPSASRSRTLKTVASGVKKRFYVRTNDRSLIYNVGTTSTTITGRPLGYDLCLFTEPASASVLQTLMLPEVITVLKRGPSPGTHYLFGIRLSATAAPGSTIKEDWEICSPTIVCWSEPDLMPVKIGSLLFGLSTHRNLSFPGQTVYQLADYSPTGSKVTNFVVIQASAAQVPVAEFQTRSRSRHLLFNTPVTQQVIGPPGPHENLTELTVYLPAKQATAISRRLRGRYEVHVTPGLGNQVLIRVTGPAGGPQKGFLGLGSLDDTSFEGLNIPKPNTAPLLLHRRINNEGRAMRFIQGTVDELITSLIKIS